MLIIEGCYANSGLNTNMSNIGKTYAQTTTIASVYGSSSLVATLKLPTAGTYLIMCLAKSNISNLSSGLNISFGNGGNVTVDGLGSNAMATMINGGGVSNVGFVVTSAPTNIYSYSYGYLNSTYNITLFKSY